MKETHITIYIHDLEISDKSKSFLARVGLMKLDDLLNCNMTELSAMRNISEDVLQELNGVIAHSDVIISFFEERAKRIKEILPNVQDAPIESLGLGTRATNALRRGGIHTVGALIQMSQKDIFELRNVGVLSREEITKAIEIIVQSGKIVYHEREEESKTIIETTPESSRLSELLPEIESIRLDDVPFSVRARNALKRANIQTADELVQMSEKDIMGLRNVGAQTRDEILAVINAIIREGRAYFDNLTSQYDQKHGDEPIVESASKGFDFAVIDILTERFGFKPAKMTEWFGLSRQSVYNALEKRLPQRRSTWTGKTISESELSILAKLIENKSFDYTDDEVTCCCMNNRQDDFVCLFIYENEIKCLFLKDLPDEIREQVVSKKMHMYTERELAGESDGRVINVLTKPFYRPDNPERFRANAQFRGMTSDEYAVFISGYPYLDQRSVTDEQIVAFMKENMVDGKVYISSDPKNQWIRSIASRNGYTIKSFIELYGFESRLDGSELTSDAAKERHREELRQYVVHDNVVYFPTDSHIYKVLQTYTYKSGTDLNSYIRSLGFERTTERPDVAVDVLEKDMEVRQSDGTFEDKVFAMYPLIGSRILKPETVDKLNENARKYIDLVLREPWTKLSLRAEMQITLALINNAKNWKNEENSNFWNYITLQFGYRDASGSVVRLLQSSLENAMKRNQRLFLEDANGRAFKTTVVIHALSTKKSWMALFDFLFDFYKSNLNWRVIPNDPLISVMVHALQRKLSGGNEEDVELTISSKAYSFQEGIRKLILYRPVYTRNLFERLIGKIDSLVNSETKKVNTYEELLCEEWFKEKIIAIANTKKSERQTQVTQRDVAIDYSRIRAKFILKNETDVQLILPDIRLKNEEIKKATLYVSCNGREVMQQNLSWYGNELGKTLNGVAASISVGSQEDSLLNITIGDENWKVFECAICDDCGRVAVAGKEVDGKLEFANSSYDPEIEYYLLRDSRDIDLDLDEEDEDDTEEIGKNDYILCSKCGALIHESLKADPPCTCGLTHYVKLRKARKSGSRGDGKCPSCNFGTFKTFYLGYDAATAVLGTSLFEELPESEKVLKSKKSAQPVKKSLFGAAKQGAQVDIVRRKRQFLSFSDSRGEAAFFASYMTAAYSEFLRRRGIWHVVEKNKENMAAHPWEIQHFVDELTSYFDSCRTFAEPGDKGVENLTATSRKNAWIAVLNEMVNARRSTSLASLGILKFNYKGNAEEIMSGVAEAYQQKVEDVKALFDLLAMEIVYHGALEGDCDLTDDEREYIFYTPKPKRVKRCKDMDKDKKKSYLAGWSAAIRKNGSLLKNGRLKRVMSVLNLDEASANELLQMYWDEVLRGEESLSTAGNDEFYFSTERFTVSSGTEDIPIYGCDVCGKTTTMNCKDMCTTLKCGGHLRRITHDSLLKDNHYAKLYQSSLMQPLHIKEHTAQLGREEQQKYQEMFVNKEINALSCSTTFEMGVDVGDLETVYLRNMPPSPANYVQRAGRAGRGKNAAAFSLTYAKLSSHDFTYFKNPENMITGKIGVPLFTVRNEKIILRHIFAVALSDFFAKQVDVYNSNNADVLLSGDGWERFCAYLSSKSEHLKDVLKASIPESMHRVMGINDFSWTEKLVGKDGVLKVSVDEFRGTVQYYIDEYRRLLAEGLTQQAAAVEKKLWSYRRGKEDNRGRNELIEFLVRNNVLPKYGFPVDTVELYQNTNAATDKKLQMVRDLQLAISEYAPDSQVVADGKLYTSRYIRKLPQTTGQDWETAYIAQCNNPSCMTWNHRLMEPDEGGEPCVSCHVIISKSRWKQAIEPRKGFVADAKPKDVPMRKPDKAFRSDDFYIGDAQRQVMQKYAFVMKDGNRFQMETSINDSLMVVCNDDFYVCPHCGYAESTMENMEVAGFNSHQKTLEKKHITPWGKNCEVKLVKNKLCHVFKTDVVRLVFSTPQAGNQEVMLSVMYALLEALSSVMDIERNDIKGCLHKIVYDNKLIYAIVLYDAVAGGAGHVRRLVTEDGRCFRQVVEKAIAITKGCNCSPSCYSCLRNYYNQKIHDLLNRKYAYDFLENYYGELEPITNEEFENGELYNV